MLIGIGGVSRAGKSTLAKLIAQALLEKGKSVEIIHQDEWVINEVDLPRIRDKADWETPESIDWPTIKIEIVLSLKQNDIVLLEGLFCFSNSKVLQMMNRKYFVRISKKLFKQRKIEDLRWGGIPEPSWYIEHIWTAYKKFGSPILDKDYHTLSGGRFFDIDQIIKDLEADIL